MAHTVVTIDGPAGSGKSTVAGLLAGKLGAVFLDTGAMYRAVTVAVMEKDMDPADEAAVLGVIAGADFEFLSRDGKMEVKIDSRDVTERIRLAEVTQNVRHIASAAAVREKLVRMQRDFAAGVEQVVTEGRDQGTVAFPDAEFKFFLTASIEERARRRTLELNAKGSTDSVEDVKKAILSRDKGDCSRSVGPLRIADDGIQIDTTDLNIVQVVEILYEIIKTRS